MANVYPIFCNAVMQDGLEQMSYFLACGFIKDDIRICCEKLWSNMKFIKQLDRLENKLKFGILLNRFMQYSEMHEIFLEKCLTN